MTYPKNLYDLIVDIAVEIGMFLPNAVVAAALLWLALTQAGPHHAMLVGERGWNPFLAYAAIGAIAASIWLLTKTFHLTIAAAVYRLRNSRNPKETQS